jgi:hypothetical protein
MKGETMCIDTDDIYNALENCIISSWQTHSGREELTWTGDRIAALIKRILEIHERDLSEKEEANGT